MEIHNFRRIFAVLFITLIVTLHGYAQPSFVPDSRISFFGDPSLNLDPDSFARLALIVSGTGEVQMEGLFSQLRSLSAELKNGLASDADERVKGEAILALLYKKTLTRYSEFQTKVDIALTTGAYNCVSSAILFYYLAKTVDLNVEGVETPDHSFCTVLVGDKRIDVETTNPYGFDPGARKELPDVVASQKKYVLVPQTKYRARKAIGERRLLALVYNNRISDLERKGDYAQAVGLALDANALQGKGAVQKELAERFINYGISLSKKRKYIESLDFIINARNEWGDYSGYKEFISGTAGNSVNDLMLKNDFAGTFTFLAKYASMIEPSEYEKLTVFAYSREADRISRKGSWLEAAAVLESGLEEMPGQKDLSRQRNVYRQNYAIDVHNKGADAYNKGDFAAVKKLLEDGLVLVPESTLLRNDLERLK